MFVESVKYSKTNGLRRAVGYSFASRCKARLTRISEVVQAEPSRCRAAVDSQSLFFRKSHVSGRRNSSADVVKYDAVNLAASGKEKDASFSVDRRITATSNKVVRAVVRVMLRIASVTPRRPKKRVYSNALIDSRLRLRNTHKILSAGVLNSTPKSSAHASGKSQPAIPIAANGAYKYLCSASGWKKPENVAALAHKTYSIMPGAKAEINPSFSNDPE